MHCNYNANVPTLHPTFVQAIASPALPHSALPGSLSFALLGAAYVLREVEAGVSLSAALPELNQAWHMSAQDRGAVQAIAFHALRNWGRLKAVRGLLVPRLPKPVLLRIYLEIVLSCEHQQSNRTTKNEANGSSSAPSYPAHTLVDQAVTGAHAHPELAHASGLVNAMLRRWLREAASLENALPRTPESLWNHPNWWIEKLALAAPENWRELIKLNGSAAPMSLRVNLRHGSRESYLARLNAAGLAASAIGESGLVLAQATAVERLPGFADGDVSVQDYGAQLAAELLDAQAGHEVLDACAAPGGKTAHILERADCRVTAVDNDPARLARMAAGLERLKLAARAHLVCADALVPASWRAGLYDRVLLDAPCSASGVVRRHPDIRWLRRASDIAVLAATQARLLDALWAQVKPGGRLLFCTCSVFPEEGTQQAEQFAARTPDATRLPLALSTPLMLQNSVQNAEHHAGQLMPSVAPAHDGFFYALFEKTFIES